MLTAAAIAKIHSHHVEAGAKCFVCSRNHVEGTCRAFHAVPHADGRMSLSFFLPAELRDDFHIRLNLNQPFFIRWQGFEPIRPRPRVCSQCLSMATAERRVRFERLCREFICDPCKKTLNLG